MKLSGLYSFKAEQDRRDAALLHKRNNFISKCTHECVDNHRPVRPATGSYQSFPIWRKEVFDITAESKDLTMNFETSRIGKERLSSFRMFSFAYENKPIFARFLISWCWMARSESLGTTVSWESISLNLIAGSLEPTERTSYHRWDCSHRPISLNKLRVWMKAS